MILTKLKVKDKERHNLRCSVQVGPDVESADRRGKCWRTANRNGFRDV